MSKRPRQSPSNPSKPAKAPTSKASKAGTGAPPEAPAPEQTASKTASKASKAASKASEPTGVSARAVQAREAQERQGELPVTGPIGRVRKAVATVLVDAEKLGEEVLARVTGEGEPASLYLADRREPVPVDAYLRPEPAGASAWREEPVQKDSSAEAVPEDSLEGAWSNVEAVPEDSLEGAWSNSEAVPEDSLEGAWSNVAADDRGEPDLVAAPPASAIDVDVPPAPHALADDALR